MLVEPGLQRAVKAHENKVTLARCGLDRVALAALGRFGPEPNRVGAVTIRFDVRAEAVEPAQPLIGLENRAVLTGVNHE